MSQETQNKNVEFHDPSVHLTIQSARVLTATRVTKDAASGLITSFSGVRIVLQCDLAELSR